MTKYKIKLFICSYDTILDQENIAFHAIFFPFTKDYSCEKQIQKSEW